MKSGYYSIGKMAELNNVSVPTLRLYDEMGLLKPKYINPDTGYRYYDINQNSRLDMIIYMKELGLNLTQIGYALEQGDIMLIEQILMEKNEQLHAQMRELKLTHNAVERAINSLERYRKSPAPGMASLEYIDQRYVLGIPCRDNFYEKDIESYEKALIQLREHLKEDGVQKIHTYNIGTSIKESDYTRDQMIPDQIFAFVDKPIIDQLKNRDSYHLLESGMYACIYSDSYEDELKYAKLLKQFCKKNNYTICGDYICEVMTEFNVFDSDSRPMFLRLQIPVRFDCK